MSLIELKNYLSERREASLGEITGALRMGVGHPADP